MREISLTILDIAQNSIEAQATKITIEILEDIEKNTIVIEIRDNGQGIDEKEIVRVIDPFYTSRKTRKVGMGLSMFEAMCNRSGGSLKIDSTKGKGTVVRGIFEYNDIDRPPIGRIEDTILGLLLNPGIDIEYIHKVRDKVFSFDSKEIKNIICDGINIEMINWLRDFIRGNLENIKANLWG